MSCDAQWAGGGLKKTQTETCVNQKFAVKSVEMLASRMHVGRRCRMLSPGGLPCRRGWCLCCSCCCASSPPLARAAKSHGPLGVLLRGRCPSCAARRNVVQLLRWRGRCVVVVEHAMARACHAPTLVCALARRVQHVVQHAERHWVCRVHARKLWQAMRWKGCDGMCHASACDHVGLESASCCPWQQGEGRWKTRWVAVRLHVGRRSSPAGNRRAKAVSWLQQVRGCRATRPPLA